MILQCNESKGIMTILNDKPSPPGGDCSDGQESWTCSVRLHDSACCGPLNKTLFMQTMVKRDLLPHGPYYVAPAIKDQLHLIIL
jgi:hypothetical protein